MKLKRICISALMILSMAATPLFAQGGGGGMSGGGQRQGGQGQGQGGQQRQQGPRDFLAMTGYFEIDNEAAIDKMNIKEEATITAVNIAIQDYTVAMGDVALKHSEQVKALTELNELMAQLQAGGATGDPTAMREQMQKAMAGSADLRTDLVALHTTLNEKMTSILDEKTLKKWTSFYEALCREKNFRLDGGEERGERGEGDGERPQRQQR